MTVTVGVTMSGITIVVVMVLVVVMTMVLVTGLIHHGNIVDEAAVTPLRDLLIQRFACLHLRGQPQLWPAAPARRDVCDVGFRR